MLFEFAGPALAEPSCTIVWTGSVGNDLWADPGNWAPSRIPGPGDVVCIEDAAGTITFDGSNGTSTTLISSLRSSAPLAITGGELGFTDTSTGSSVGGLSMSGGQVGDSSTPQGSLTVDGDFSWTGGGFAAPATQTPRPVLTVTAGHAAVINYESVYPHGATRWDLSFASPLTFPRNSNISLTDGASVTASSLVTLGDGASITPDNLPGPFTLTGKGVLTTTGGTASITVPVHLAAAAGKVIVPGGTLALTGGGSITMPLSVSSNAVLTLSGQALGEGTSGTGTGTVQITSATAQVTGKVALTDTVQVASGELSVAAKAALTVGGFEMPGGQVGDSSARQGPLTVDGDFSWTGGGFAAPATQTPRPVLTVTAGHTAVINYESVFPHGDTGWGLVFASPLTFPASSTIGLSSGASITSSSLVTLGDSADITDNGDPGPFTLTGHGVLTKTPTTGTATIGVPVISAGTIRASAGTLSLTSLANTGTLDLAEGTIAVSSAYAPAATARLAVTIGGTTAGATYGQLQVSGTVSLAGTLEITTAKKFIPKAGQTFDITTSTSTTSGKFSSVVQSPTTNGLEYKVKVNATGVTLTATKTSG
jgi:large repetitive protein